MGMMMMIGLLRGLKEPMHKKCFTECLAYGVGVSFYRRKLDRWRYTGFPGGPGDKDSACNVGDSGSIPGSGSFPGKGNGNPLHYFAWRIP